MIFHKPSLHNEIPLHSLSSHRTCFRGLEDVEELLLKVHRWLYDVGNILCLLLWVEVTSTAQILQRILFYYLGGCYIGLICISVMHTPARNIIVQYDTILISVFLIGLDPGYIPKHHYLISREHITLYNSPLILRKLELTSSIQLSLHWTLNLKAQNRVE